MLIAMTHEMHGVHIAYSDIEAAECEKTGWVKDMKLSAYLATGVKPDEDEEVTEVKRKPGRPPKVT